jgi:hypothetical protein
MYEIVSKRQMSNSPAFQARLSGVPLGPWHSAKQEAVRDIMRCGVQGDVVDRTGVAPVVNRRSLGWS